MATLVLLEGVVIVLLGLLVCGLLRSHAEILRTLHQLGAGEDPGEAAHDRPEPVAVRGPVPAPGVRATQADGRPAADVVGTTPDGEAVQIGVRGTRHDTLIAFLSSGCGTCGEFWRSFRRPAAALDLPDGTRLVVVTKSPAEESVSRLRDLTPPEVPVVMSTEAWEAYGVPVTPFFVHVDGTAGQVVGQGAGNTWSQVLSLLRQASADDRPLRSGHAGRPVDEEAGHGVQATQAGVDRKLMAAGIHPGDPSLYPSRKRWVQP